MSRIEDTNAGKAGAEAATAAAARPRKHRRRDRLRDIAHAEYDALNPASGRVMYHVPQGNVRVRPEKQVYGMKRWEITHFRRLVKFLNHIPRYDRAGKRIQPPNPMNIAWWECPAARISTADHEQWTWFTALDGIDRFTLVNFEYFESRMRQERKRHRIVSIDDPSIANSKKLRY